MLLLLLSSAENLFAIEASFVVEVIPRVQLRVIPHSPTYLAGLLNYRGVVIPVLDFSILIGERMSRNALSTRIVILKSRDSEKKEHLIGLIAENVSHLQHFADNQESLPNLCMDTAPYLGSIYQMAEGLVQLILVNALFDEKLKAALYGSAEGPALS